MTRQELEKKTIALLRSLAKTYSIRLRPTLKKQEIIEILLPYVQGDEGAVAEAPAGREKEAGPALEGHAGEGEAQDEKVIFTPSPVLDLPVPPFSEIPREYGVNQVVLLVRDPWWMHAYWEVTPDGLGEGNRRVADPEARLTLRVYDLTERDDFGHFWDIEVYQRIGSWYIDAGRPDHAYLVDIGMKSRGGAFAAVARSGIGRTPPDGPSMRFDEEWWVIEDERERIASSYDEGRRFSSDHLEGALREALASSDRFSLSLLKK